MTAGALLSEARRPVRFGLLLTAAIGVALAAVFFYTGLLDAEFAANWADQLVGARSGPAVAAAMGLALLIGAAMVVLPCGFPAVFLMPSILEREHSTPGRLRSLGAFALGATLPLAAAGAILGLAGGGLWDSLSGQDRVVFAATFYPLLGLVAVGYALNQFGILNLQGAFVRVTGPAMPGEEAPTRRSAVLGATFGAGLGIACPMPTYYALLAWVAVAASPWYGALVLGAYGLGRVLPPIVLGLLMVAGTSRRAVSQRLVAAHDRIEWGSAVVMATLGVFLIALFGGFIGTSLI
jgi:cytochrome c biogenesis protein CcdA